MQVVSLLIRDPCVLEVRCSNMGVSAKSKCHSDKNLESRLRTSFHLMLPKVDTPFTESELLFQFTDCDLGVFSVDPCHRPICVSRQPALIFQKHELWLCPSAKAKGQGARHQPENWLWPELPHPLSVLFSAQVVVVPFVSF